MINTTDKNLSRYSLDNLHRQLINLGEQIHSHHVVALTTENKHHFKQYEHLKNKYKLVLSHILKRSKGINIK